MMTEEYFEEEDSDVAISKFRQRAADIAARFLHTVVVIDDEAYRFFSQTESGKVQKIELAEPQLLPGSETGEAETQEPPDPRNAEAGQTATTEDARGGNATDNASAASLVESEGAEPVLSTDEKPVVATIEDATVAEIDQGLNTRKLVASFARLGLVCGVIEPEADGKDLDALLHAAQRADVLIVDWVFNGDGGKLARRIVKSVITKDLSERIRLIIIYTGDPGIAKVVDELKQDAAKELATVGREPNVLVGDRTRIAVLSKVTSPRSKNAPVSLDDLPERVLIEFAALYSGLVTNAAMEGLAVLRNNTHQLLGRLRQQLDVAFLTHRMLLPQPDDANEFLTELVGQEVASLLQSHEIGNVSNMPAIEDWFEVAAKKVPPASKELSNALGVTDDQRLDLLRLGAPDFLKAKVKVEEKELEKAKKKAKENNEKEKTKEEMERERQRALEDKIHGDGSLMFLEPSRKPLDFDLEFAHVASMVHRYENARAPRLTLGTVVRTADRDYLVCIQPVCDCVRVRAPRRFAFLSAEKSGTPNLLLKEGANYVRLRVTNKVTDLVQCTFAATEGTDVVYAVANGEDFQFKTVDSRVLTWVGQLKFPQSQRLTQLFSALLARVGLDESEWWRRFDRDAFAGGGTVAHPAATDGGSAQPPSNEKA